MKSVVVHYKELALKGKNRPWFIQLLVRNIQAALAGLHVASVRSIMGRIELELGDEEARRLEELLTALGVEPQQAVVAPELRRRRPAKAEPSSERPLSATAPKKMGMDAETSLRDIGEELEAEDAPLSTSKPALPARPKDPPSPRSEPPDSEAAKMMMQIRGLIYELAEFRALLREREAEIVDLRAQLDDARAQIEELERTPVRESDHRGQ